MRHDAEKNLQAWAKSKYFVQLEDAEVNQLLAELVDRTYASPPKVVFEIVKRLFPESFSKSQKKEQEPMSTSTRMFPPRKPQAATPPQQTQQEITKVINDYAASRHWEKVAPQFMTPWVGDGSTGAINSRANTAFLFGAIKQHLAAGKRLRVHDIMEMVFALAQAGVLERIPQVVEVPVEAPKPTERDLHNRQVKIERAMNRRDRDGDSDSPIKGGKEAAKPLIKPIDNSNIIEAAASEKAAAENAIINTALDRISRFTGHTHGRTASGRAAMREVFQAAMDEGKPAEEVLRAVEAEASRLSGDSSIR